MKYVLYILVSTLIFSAVCSESHQKIPSRFALLKKLFARKFSAHHRRSERTNSLIELSLDMPLETREHKLELIKNHEKNIKEHLPQIDALRTELIIKLRPQDLKSFDTNNVYCEAIDNDLSLLHQGIITNFNQAYDLSIALEDEDNISHAECSRVLASLEKTYTFICKAIGTLTTKNNATSYTSSTSVCCYKINAYTPLSTLLLIAHRQLTQDELDKATEHTRLVGPPESPTHVRCYDKIL